MVSSVLLDTPIPQVQQRSTVWPWRVGLVLDSPSLIGDISGALLEMNAPDVFRMPASAPPFEIARMIERDRPEILFVELAQIVGAPSDWIQTIRAGEDMPLIIAVHPTPEPEEMISALRAGASEFLCLPVRPSVFDALDRLGTLLESRRTIAVERGRMAGILSAKGGCGATTLACYLAVALHSANPSGKVLVADLDHQSSSVHRVFRTASRKRLGDALDSVRRLNSGSWPDYITSVYAGVDLLSGLDGSLPLPEPWRIESLFRFMTRHYSWILADLGRHLHPTSWAFLQNVDELFVVTAPDVLALFQTRSILQTLTSRGFDKSRVRLVLNRNQSSPQDFWVESIEKMFEMSIIAILPGDSALQSLRRDRFEFPATSPFGRAMAKLAGRISKPVGPDAPRKAA